MQTLFYPKPTGGHVVFEWREEGHGRAGRFYDSTRKPRDHEGWGWLELAPEGGLHGVWVWKFRFDGAEITGRHEDRERATGDCELAARAFWERDRKHNREMYEKYPNGRKDG